MLSFKRLISSTRRILSRTRGVSSAAATATATPFAIHTSAVTSDFAMSDDASDTSSIASVGDTWELIARSPSLLHDDFASIQSDTSSFDWSPLQSLGLKSSSSINTVGKEKKGPGKKSSFKLLRRLSHEKENTLLSESSFAQPDKKGFLKNMKINRKKGKGSKKSYDESMPAPTTASSTPPRSHFQPRRVSEDSLSGFDLCSIHRTSFDVMSRFDDADDDSSFLDTIPKLYLSSPSTASQSSPVQPTTPTDPVDEQSQPQQRPVVVPMVSYNRLETIMEVCEEAPESDDAPITHPHAPDASDIRPLDAATYTDGAAGVQSEAIFFGSRQAPLPAGHLASLAFTHILPQGLIPLYEIQITWVPNDVRLPAARLNVTRGYGSLSKFAAALFKEYHEGSTSYLRSLLADFPKAYDGPTLPQKTEYRAEMMQHYFDLLFGIRTRGEEYVLDNVYITPEFFAILHGDAGEEISRDEAWGEWEYTLERRIVIERWERRNEGQDNDQRAQASTNTSVPREDRQPSSQLSNSSALGESSRSHAKSQSVESGHWINEPSIDTPPSHEILDNGEFSDLIDSFPMPKKQQKPVEVRVISSPTERSPSSQTSIRCSSSATALSIDPSASLDVSSDFHSPSCSDKSGLYETPNSSVTDLSEFAGMGQTDEHVRHVMVGSKALATFMSPQPTPEKLVLGQEGVISIDLTTRFFFNTIPVLLCTKESWAESLVRIYSALRLPFNSMSLKGDVEVIGAIHLGVPHDEEVELKSKPDLMRWLGMATEKRIWVEDW
ncbi:hypothetical protein IAR50_005965 [Cryptococcus sp. DSM 104548]